MYYFVPAWYINDSSWYCEEVPWYYHKSHMEFDDTVNQMRLFHKENEPCTLVILQYMPRLRERLNRQQLYSIPRLSLFDHLQGITTDNMTTLTLESFKWEEGIEFIYTPFVIMARKMNKMKAIIEFSLTGRLFWITIYDDKEQVEQKLMLDDRGFVSNITYYDKNSAHHRDYLNDAGQWQFREYLTAKHDIEINPNSVYSFSQNSYRSMTELVTVESRRMLKEFTSQDVVVIADHPQHNTIVIDAIKQAKVVMSYFSYRQTTTDDTSWLKNVSLIVADTKSLQQNLEQQFNRTVEHVLPFDTRLALGKSQRVSYINLYCIVSESSLDKLYAILPDLLEIMIENKDVTLTFSSYTDTGLKDISETVTNLLAGEKEEDTLNLMPFDDKKDTVERVYTQIIHQELDLIEGLEFSRLMIDLSDEPDLFMQIASISSGIPQINCVETSYVTHKVNGIVLPRLSDISSAIHYYIDTLKNWNMSLAYSVKQIEKYSSYEIVNRWKKYLTESHHEEKN